MLENEKPKLTFHNIRIMNNASSFEKAPLSTPLTLPAVSLGVLYVLIVEGEHSGGAMLIPPVHYR
jgi:hypothetical protein